MDTSRIRRPLQNLWLTGFLGRLACCAVPHQNINDMILSGDSQADVSSDNDSDSGIDDLHPETSVPQQSFSQRKIPGRQPSAYSLPSPTFSPSRRDLDRWDPSCVIGVTTSCCSPSCAGSTATTASTTSEEEGYYDQPYNASDCAEEIRSNATTLVVSHKQSRDRDSIQRRNQLLTSTLASAEQRLRKQLLEEDARAEYLKARRQQQQQRRGPR